MNNADNESVRLKAAQAVLDVVGMTKPEAGLWGWGIGPTTAQGIREEIMIKDRLKMLTSNLL